jgi:hypothetical protein
LNGFVGDLFAVGNRVFYNGGGIGIGSTTCSGGTCTPGVTLPSSRGRAALSADATRLAFVDTSANGRNLAMCDYTGGSCTSTPLVTGDFSAVKATQILAGKFYWIQPGRQDFNEGKLRQCALSDSCATIKDLTNGLDFPSTLLVDASGSYWFSATSPKLQHCAPDTCTGGTKDLTGAFTSPSSLTADAKFVYWVSAGAIWRVAKP